MASANKLNFNQELNEFFTIDLLLKFLSFDVKIAPFSNN